MMKPCASGLNVMRLCSTSLLLDQITLVRKYIDLKDLDHKNKKHVVQHLIKNVAAKLTKLQGI